MKDSHPGKAYLAEALGTFLLVFAIVAAVSLYGASIGGGAAPIPGIVVPWVALAAGFALFIGIQTLGGISGGHFNPAVTIGLLSIRKISPTNAALYIVAQVVGALAATFLIALVLNEQGQAVNYAAPALDKGISTGAGIVLEAVMVFFLVWTIVATAVNPDGPKEWAPAAISAALALGIILIGQWTGASLNPARALAPDVTNALFGGEGSGGFGPVKDFLLVYLVAPIAAGVLAATICNTLVIRTEATTLEPPAPSERSPL